MNPKYVTSLELSQKLKEAGVKQESEWYWVELWRYQVLDRVELWSKEQLEKFNSDECYVVSYSAFHVGELGEMLSYQYHTWKTGENEEEWCCAFFSEPEFDSSYGHWETGTTEAEARGKMVLYLKENKLI